MNTIQIFDPSLCCSTGVCGADVDQELVRFAADVAWAKDKLIEWTGKSTVQSIPIKETATAGPCRPSADMAKWIRGCC